MPLRISFHCTGWVGNKPRMSGGLHLVLSDECEVDPNREDPKLSDIQREALRNASSAAQVRTNLLYINTIGVEPLLDRDGELHVTCPTCNTDYTLSREQYEQAYQRFVEER